MENKNKNPQKRHGAKNPMQSLKRILSYAFAKYKIAMVFVVICVIFSSAANAVGAALLGPLVTEIEVQVKMGGTDLSRVYTYVFLIGAVYITGAVCAFIYNRVMMYIAQGTLKRLRDEMFAKMQRLPLKYYDANTNGDIMSLYTNDVDTLRQLLSQTIPQIISSVITVVAVFSLMLFYSVTLTAIIVCMLFVMFTVIRIFGGKSAKYFAKQQLSLAHLNGFVEEMTEGQKVIKVFCYEEKAKERFKKLNDDLNESSYKANGNAFILGPVNNNLGYIQYILVAIVGVAIIFSGNTGAFLSLYGTIAGGSFALGLLVSFLQFSRQLNMPINQVAQQFNAIVMALAGAERIFEMIDEPAEDSGGEVMLSYGEYEKDKWAW